MPLERNIEGAFVAAAKRRGCLALKWVCPGRRGVPDRIVLCPDGRTMYIELKRSGETPSQQQFAVLRMLQSRGHFAVWADNLADAEAYLDEFLTRG